MALKDWLSSITSAAGKSRSDSANELSIDDLITLERYDEAQQRLKRRVAKNKGDYRARIQLADVYLKTGNAGDAIEEYLSIADRYASEGFFDKAVAALAKLSRLIPQEERLKSKTAAIKRAKRLELRRQLVVDTLGSVAWAMEVRQHWPELIQGPFIEVLSRDQIKKIFPLLQIRRMKAGELLADRGESKEELCVILTGKVGAEIALASGSDTDLRTFEGGDVIGERALLKRKPWPARYRAKEPTKILVLNREALEQSMLGEDDPRALLNVFQMQGHDREVAAAASKVKVAGA